jgi:hypothetical protein
MTCVFETIDGVVTVDIKHPCHAEAQPDRRTRGVEQQKFPAAAIGHNQRIHKRVGHRSGGDATISAERLAAAEAKRKAELAARAKEAQEAARKAAALQAQLSAAERNAAVADACARADAVRDEAAAERMAAEAAGPTGPTLPPNAPLLAWTLETALAGAACGLRAAGNATRFAWNVTAQAFDGGGCVAADNVTHCA